jgi:hypothetical protein
MERTALYRRALAPIMIATGVIGTLGAVAGIALHIDMLHRFCRFWLMVGVGGMGVALGIARQQSIKVREPFWTPPARRVVAALIPALVLGASLGIGLLELSDGDVKDYLMVPTIWVALYGCALHGAGYFTTSGLRLFGWIYLLPACAALPFAMRPVGQAPWYLPHLVMGVWFGVSQLIYGAYLFVTEKKVAAV